MAADVGASTGGFTDCLLQRCASKIYAIDVGYGQLAWHLRQDPRVVVMERVNVRYLESLPEPIDLATVDVSFISLTLVLPSVRGWLRPDGDIIVLIKPQFEVGKGQVGKKGIVKNPDLHASVLNHVIEGGRESGFCVNDILRTSVRGQKGNQEFFVHLEFSEKLDDKRLTALVEEVVWHEKD